LGKKYEIDVEMISKPREAYQSAEHQASSLPAAPAVMVGDAVAAQGPSISEEKLEAVIRSHLELPSS
jgi:hypothetical protein